MDDVTTYYVLSVLKSGIQVHTSNIIRKLTSFVRGIKVGYTYCCNQRVFHFFSGKEPTLHESEPILMSECFQGRKIVKFDLSVG